jgi:hypothetical protein
MEALIGVLIGAVIGYVAAITTLLVEHRRWRKEFKLQYLITERKRREEQCDKIRELLEKGLSESSYPFELGINMFLRLPEDVGYFINRAWKDIDRRQPEGKQELYQKVTLILGAYLAKIDKQIEELTK